MPNQVTITKTRTKEINPDLSQTIKVVTQTSKETPAAKPIADHGVNVQAYGLLVAITAVCAWGFVEVFKEFIKARLKLKGQSKPWYYLTLVRGLAVAVGGGCGFLLADNFGAGTPVAVLVGCAGGALSSVVVKLIKAKLAKAAADIKPK